MQQLAEFSGQHTHIDQGPIINWPDPVPTALVICSAVFFQITHSARAPCEFHDHQNLLQKFKANCMCIHMQGLY